MKRIYWSIADKNNLKYFEMMKNSFRKFHPNDELRLFGEKELSAIEDSQIFYRMGFRIITLLTPVPVVLARSCRRL